MRKVDLDKVIKETDMELRLILEQVEDGSKTINEGVTEIQIRISTGFQ